MHEQDKGLRPHEAALVWDAAFKRDALEDRLGGVAAAGELDGQQSRGLRDRVDRLSAFADHYSHMEGGPFESPLIDPEKKSADRKAAIRGASDKTIANADAAIAYLLENDGILLEHQEGKDITSPATLIRDVAGMETGDWETLKSFNKKLHFLYFARDRDKTHRIRSISLNTRLAEDLVASGRLSDETVQAFQEFKKRREASRHKEPVSA